MSENKTEERVDGYDQLLKELEMRGVIANVRLINLHEQYANIIGGEVEGSELYDLVKTMVGLLESHATMLEKALEKYMAPMITLN